MNLGIGGDRVENVARRAIDLPLPSSVKNIAILCGTNNIPIDKKSNGINFSVCGLIPREECWSANRVFINELNKILKYQCNINGFGFIFQDHGWTLANGSLDCSLFYKDLLHLIEQGNVKLAKSIALTITSLYNHINLSIRHIVILLDKKFNLLFLFR